MQPCWDGRAGPSCSAAVGMVYTRPTPGETKQPRLGAITYSIKVPPIHDPHLSLTATCITHSQTVCRHRGLSHTGSHLYEASALTVYCHTSLCIHSHPKRKEKKKRRIMFCVSVEWNMTLDPTCCTFIRLSQLSRRRRCRLGGNRFSVCCSFRCRGSIVQPAGTVHCHTALFYRLSLLTVSQAAMTVHLPCIS